MSASLHHDVAVLPGGPRLPYVEAGEPDGVPVVFLHGVGDSWRSFQPVLPRLPSWIRAVALTQRGHGDASRPSSGYAVDDFASDLQRFLDLLAIDAAVLVGHSMGSAVVRRFAARRPDRALGLVLVGAASTDRGTEEARRSWTSVLEELADPVEKGFVRPLVEEAVAGPVPHGFLETMVEEGVKVPAFVWRAAFEARWRATDDPQELERLGAPTLICWGELDPRYPRSEQELLASRISDARLVVYPGAGHALHWEQPERFAADVAGFVQGLELPG